MNGLTAVRRFWGLSASLNFAANLLLRLSSKLFCLWVDFSVFIIDYKLVGHNPFGSKTLVYIIHSFAMLRLINIFFLGRQYHKCVATFGDYKTITWKILVLLALCSILYTAFLVSFETTVSSSDALINQTAFVAANFFIDYLPGQMFFNAMPQATVRGICTQTQLAYRMLTLLVLSGNISNYYYHYGLYTKRSSKDRHTTARHQIVSFCKPADCRLRLGRWYVAGTRPIQPFYRLSQAHVKRLRVFVIKL
jgi:hypothetical protein